EGDGAAAAPIRPRMIPVAEIKVPRDRRDPGDVAELADSIRELGLLQPITVTPDYRLVAGGRRLRAFKALRLPEIPAVVRRLDEITAELAEIDENLVRLELTHLERGEQLARRKALYLTLHPETGQGKAAGAGKGTKGGKAAKA